MQSERFCANGTRRRARCLARSTKLARCIRNFAGHRYVVIFPRMHSQRANRLERDVLGAQNMATEKLQLSAEEWKRIEELARS